MFTRSMIALVLASLLIVPSVVTVVDAHDDDLTVSRQKNEVATTTDDTETSRTQSAQDLEARKARLQQLLQNREKSLTERKAKRCEFIKAKLQFHRDKAAEIREHRADRYQHILDRLDALADRLDTHNIDSTELREAIRGLTDIIGLYATSFTAYETELQEAVISACDDGSFTREELKALRELIVKLRSNAETVHTFVRERLRPALGDIKDEIKAQRQDAATEAETPTPETP
jgi:ABC-type transporter Mla subunit MlaD